MGNDRARKAPAQETWRDRTDGEIYLVRAVGTSTYKIGYSGTPDLRFASLQSSSPVELELLGTFPGNRIYEGKIHSLFASKRLHGEWFDLSPADADKILDHAWRASITNRDVMTAKELAATSGDSPQADADTPMRTASAPTVAEEPFRPVSFDGYVDTDAAAEHLSPFGVSANRLQELRMKGGGPIYFKLGSAVRYSAERLNEWLKASALAQTVCPHRAVDTSRWLDEQDRAVVRIDCDDCGSAFEYLADDLPGPVFSALQQEPQP